MKRLSNLIFLQRKVRHFYHLTKDEMFQSAGEKGCEHFDPDDPPRRRANKLRGRDTYAHDRRPVGDTVERQTGQVRMCVVNDTKGKTLVAHDDKDWARDGDGTREIHINTAEGIWTDIRNFLRSFKGVHKKNLNGYIAIC